MWDFGGGGVWLKSFCATSFQGQTDMSETSEFRNGALTTADLVKVPAVTLGFWITKILATTLGETAGDTVSMTWNPFYIPLWTRLFGSAPQISAANLGYVVGTALFGLALILLVVLQIRARRFHPFLYWATVIASTTAGTTLADFADRSLGIGYPGGSLLLLTCVLASLFA
jgi:uncharacterized membrane-anchored protein